MVEMVTLFGIGTSHSRIVVYTKELVGTPRSWVLVEGFHLPCHLSEGSVVVVGSFGRDLVLVPVVPGGFNLFVQSPHKPLSLLGGKGTKVETLPREPHVVHEKEDGLHENRFLVGGVDSERVCYNGGVDVLGEILYVFAVT